jgi:flagellar hook protein FlgE
MNIDINAHGNESFSGITQFDASTTFYIRDQDGRATGQLTGLAIDRNGVVTGSFSNGESSQIARVALARFANNQGLENLGDGLNQSTGSSGQPEILNLGGTEGVAIASGALEMSNIDLSKEFTELIVAQRGFQANAKVITTADTILDELIRIKR